MPAISSTVSPLVRKAISSPAVCASDARPSITSRRQAVVSSAVRASLRQRRSIVSVRIGLAAFRSAQEVAQYGHTLAGEHRLGVELHALGRQLAVADGHHRVAVGGRALELGRQVGVDHQRVVAPGRERRGQALEDRAPVVLDLGRLAVHRLAAHHPAAEGLGHRLVAQAHAEHRGAALGEAPDRLGGDARLAPACTVPGETTTRAGPRASSSSTRRGVVAHHLGLGAQLAQVLDEVEGERVVVVDHEGAHLGQSTCPHASSIAPNTAPALASVSRCS